MATWCKKMLGSVRILFLAHALLWCGITVRMMLSALDPQAQHAEATESVAILLTTGCFALGIFCLRCVWSVHGVLTKAKEAVYSELWKANQKREHILFACTVGGFVFLAGGGWMLATKLFADEPKGGMAVAVVIASPLVLAPFAAWCAVITRLCAILAVQLTGIHIKAKAWAAVFQWHIGWFQALVLATIAMPLFGASSAIPHYLLMVQLVYFSYCALLSAYAVHLCYKRVSG